MLLLSLLDCNTTDTLCLKIKNASRSYILQCENLNRKLYNCNANVYFNQKYLHNNTIPKFAKIKITNTSLASKFAQQKYYCIYYITLFIRLKHNGLPCQKKISPLFNVFRNASCFPHFDSFNFVS
jgi:hypothetical protein